MSFRIRSRIALMSAIGFMAFASAAYADTVTGLNGDQIPLPSVTEFRDGDIWDAFDATATRAMHENRLPGSLKFASMTASVSVERQVGHWAIHHDGVADFAQSGSSSLRRFSDLRLKSAVYPAGPTEGTFIATPDGLLHRFVGGQWVDITIGQTVPNPNGSAMLVSERISPREAEDITSYFREPQAVATHGQTKTDPKDTTNATPTTPKPAPSPSDPTAFATALVLGFTAFVSSFFVRRKRKGGVATAMSNGPKGSISSN